MDEEWEARQRGVDRFFADNPKAAESEAAGDVTEIICDKQHGNVGFISPFVFLLKDGTLFYEGP